MQTQGDRTGDRVRCHDIEVREVGNHLQQRAHFNVLEIQRQLFTGEAGPLAQLGRVDLQLAGPPPRTGCRSGRRCAPIRPWVQSPFAPGHRPGKSSRCCIGVPKSVTSRRRRMPSGREDFRNSTTSVWPCWRMSTPTWLLGSDTMTRPGPVGAATEIQVPERLGVEVAAFGEHRRRRHEVPVAATRDPAPPTATCPATAPCRRWPV